MLRGLSQYRPRFSIPQELRSLRYGHHKKRGLHQHADRKTVKKVPWEVSEGPQSLRLQSYRVGVFDSFLHRAGGEVSAAAETIPYIFHGRQPWLTVKNAKAFLEKSDRSHFGDAQRGLHQHADRIFMCLPGARFFIAAVVQEIMNRFRWKMAQGDSCLLRRQGHPAGVFQHFQTDQRL